MEATLTIHLQKKERERLGRMALRYGFSLPEFSRKILSEVFSAIEEESFNDYEKPRTLKASLNRALRDYRAGKIQTKL